jgi:glucuronide carrier protein
MLPAAALVPRAVRAIGKKRAYIGSGVLTALGGLGISLAPASAPAIAMVCFGAVGVGLGGINTLIWALAADTVEYGEWKPGHSQLNQP